MFASRMLSAISFLSVVNFSLAQPGGGGGGGGGQGPRGGVIEDVGDAGEAAQDLALSSSQCLTPEQYDNNVPSSFPGYGSCFQYTRNEDGTATVYTTNVPDHPVEANNPNSLCYMTRMIPLPNPVKTDTNTRLPQSGAIGIATNGVYIYGGLEAGIGNSVAGYGEDNHQVLCDGHSQGTGIWHYHHPEFGCVVADENTLVGYAYDGFPIYGALTGTKDEVDTQLDECNGRDVEDGNFGYRYHVRSRSQVDETLESNDGENNTDNWKYVLGCYKGAEYYGDNDGEAVDTCAVSIATITTAAATTASATTAAAPVSTIGIVEEDIDEDCM